MGALRAAGDNYGAVGDYACVALDPQTDLMRMGARKQRYMRRALYLPTPKPLVELCLGCKHIRCNGSKCSEYRSLEKEIRKVRKNDHM